MTSAALKADLHLLSAMSGLESNIEDLLRSMVGDLKVAIQSAFGLSLTVRIGGQDVTLTTLDDEDGLIVGASILFPLSWGIPADEGSCIVLYAATPGAFVDLAADLGWATGLPEDTIVLDQHFVLPYEGSAMTGLVELTTVNQAIGMLIDQGHLPGAARFELERHAGHRGTTVPAAAAELLSGIRRGRPV